MKRICIIGSNGFAGRYLRAELEQHGYEVFGADLTSHDEKTCAVDMLDASAAERFISEKKPDCVYNLAGLASPQLSWERITDTMHQNIDISVNIALAVKEHCPSARMIMIGSANQYDAGKCDGKPVTETSPQRADSPYAVSKRAQEELLTIMAKRFDLDIVFTRSFNHIGPGQRKGFVVTDFASQIVEAERGERECITTGNLNAWRDFSDVRDTVRAYRLLFEKGKRGEIYNVGSGKAYQIRFILDTLLAMSTASPHVVSLSDGDRSTVVVSDCEKLKRDTGYEAQIPLKTSLRDVLDCFRNEKRSNA